MRHLLSLGVILATCAAVHSQEPVPPEKATDWKILFDGGELKEFEVTGPMRLEGGVLILGGNQEAELRTTLPLGQRFDLYIEYRLRGSGMVHVTAGGMFGSSAVGTSLSSAANPNAWVQAIYRSGMDANGQRVFVLRSRGQTKAGGPEWSQREVSRLFDNGPAGVRFQTWRGSTLEVRSLKFRGEVDESSWLWWTAAAVIAAIAIAFVALLVILRRRRIRIRPHSGAAPGDPTTV